MRSRLLLALLLYLVPGLVAFVAGIPPNEHAGNRLLVLEAREETTFSATAATTNSEPTKDAAPSTTDRTTTTTHTAVSTTTGASTTTSDAGSTSRTTLSAPTATASLNQSSIATNGTASAHQDALPLQPKITPGLGVAGAILILSGLLLAFIGIQNQWIHVFLSAALLASLGVVVLIIYMMHPPVRNATQGAYFVAAFFSGVAFGGMSIVFKELLEGIGCFLGGFCLSMWLLTLMAGGLLTGSGVKAGFIIAISFGCYALSLSPYTRLYALVPSTALAGATAFTLGVDCFSRAGLKEFWLYIWDLNDDIFPLGTDTYPVTRNIRVESAIIIAIAILGVISQLRVWNMVKRRKSREKRRQEAEERRKEEIDLEIGRQFQERNMKERLKWEKRYGERSETTATSTSDLPDDSKNGNTATREKKNGGIELESTPGSFQYSGVNELGNGSEISGVADEAHLQHNRQAGNELRDLSLDDVPRSESPYSFAFYNRVAAATRMHSDNVSDATATASSETGAPRSRLLGISLLRRMSKGRGKVTSESEESFATPHSDGASHSSKQAVMDDASEFSERIQDIAPYSQDDMSADAERTKVGGSDQSSEGERDSSEATAAVKANTAEEEAVSKTDALEKGEIPDQVADSPKKSVTEHEMGKQDGSECSPSDEKVQRSPSKVSSKAEKPEEGGFAIAPDEPSLDQKPSKSLAASKTKMNDEKVELSAETVKTLPERNSKVVQVYRTGEWAKHLSDADAPDLEPIAPPDDRSEGSEEPAAPVNTTELLQTALNAQPPPASESRLSVGSGLHHSKKGRRRRKSSLDISPTKLSRMPSAASSRLSLSSQPRHHPSYSSPYLPSSPYVGSPEEIDSAAKPKWKGSPSLIAMREDRMRNRLSPGSTNHDPWASRHIPGQTVEASAEYPPTFPIREEDEGEEIPLAQRRAMLQQRKAQLNPPSTPPRWSRAFPPQGSPSSMDAWRQSVRENLSQKRDPLGLTNLRPPVFGHETPSSTSLNVREAIVEGVPGADLNELHREALRRMQAAVPRQEG